MIEQLPQCGIDGQNCFSGEFAINELSGYRADMLPGLLNRDMWVNALALNQPCQACQTVPSWLMLRGLEQEKALKASTLTIERGNIQSGCRASRDAKVYAFALWR